MKTFKKNSALKKGLIVALASALVVGGTITVFAATNANKDSEGTTDASDLTITYSGTNEDTTDEAFGDDFGVEFDGDYGYYYGDDEDYYYEDWEEDYGDLTEEEITELNSLYDQMDEIWDTMFTEDTYDLSDEEYEALYDKYEEAVKDLEDQALVLEVKAGWYGDLTLDEVKELNSLYEQEDEIWESEFQAKYEAIDEEYDNATKDIDSRISELESKAGYYDDVEDEDTEVYAF